MIGWRVRSVARERCGGASRPQAAMRTVTTSRRDMQHPKGGPLVREDVSRGEFVCTYVRGGLLRAAVSFEVFGLCAARGAGVAPSRPPGDVKARIAPVV